MGDIRAAWMGLEEHWRITPSGKKMSSNMSYDFMRFTIAPAVRMILRMKIRGVKNIPKSGATILAANHLSHIDPIVIISSSRRKTHYLAKDGHFKNIFLASFMRLTGQIKTERETGGGEALSRAADILEKDRVLGIFPEGTRSKKTEKPFLLPGKTGFARLAASYPDIPVVPIGINGSREFMKPQHHKLPRPWKKVSLSYGKPVTWMEWIEKRCTLEELLVLADKDDSEVKEALARLYRLFTDEFMECLKDQGAP